MLGSIIFISRFDTELDKDGDNLLSREEILAWIIPSNEDIAEEEVSVQDQAIFPSISRHLSFFSLSLSFYLSLYISLTLSLSSILSI